MRMGPCGGGGGHDRDMDMRGVNRVVKVVVRHGDTVDAISVLYERNGREEWTASGGSRGGNPSRRKTSPIAISGRCRRRPRRRWRRPGRPRRRGGWARRLVSLREGWRRWSGSQGSEAGGGSAVLGSRRGWRAWFLPTCARGLGFNPTSLHYTDRKSVV